MKLKNALLEIRQKAMEHPAFDEEAFEKRDIESLEREGGDIFDWTRIAILADDALKGRRE